MKCVYKFMLVDTQIKKIPSFQFTFIIMKDLHHIAVEHYSHCKWLLSREFNVELLNHYADSIHQRQNMMVVSNPEISEFEFFNTKLIFSGLGCYNFIIYHTKFFLDLSIFTQEMTHCIFESFMMTNKKCCTSASFWRSVPDLSTYLKSLQNIYFFHF